MINVTPEYRAAVNAYDNMKSREVIAKLELYLDGPSNPPLILDYDSLISVDLLEEVGTASSLPWGGISANEIDISIKNIAGEFTPINKNGPHYGKLHPNVLMKPYYGIVLEDDSIEWIPLGTFWSGDWSNPGQSVNTNVTGLDRLANIMKVSTPNIRIQYDVSFIEAYTILLNEIGLNEEEYNIDDSIVGTLPYFWLEEDTIGDALKSLNVCSNSSIFCDRYGVLQIRSNLTESAAPLVVDDATQIFRAENLQRYNTAYSAVRIKYSAATKNQNIQVLKLENISIPSGISTLTNLKFQSTPIDTVRQVILSNTTTCEVINVDYGTNTLSITVSNTSSNQLVDITVIADVINLVDTSLVVQDNSFVESIGYRELVVDAFLITTRDTASSLGELYLDLVSDPYSEFSFTLRGDPSLELMDTFTAEAPTDMIEAVGVKIKKASYKWNGSLDCVLECRRAYDAEARGKYAFVGPGMYARINNKEPETTEYAFIGPGMYIM